MATLTDTMRSAEFIVRESNGTRSRGTAVFDSTTDWAGAAIPAGQVYAVVGGVTVAFDGNAVDGSEDAAGILYAPVAAAADVTATVVLRDAEVKLSDLTYDGTIAEVTASLLALGLIVR
tara:strand:- start:157 stop:513 length:357 start_codon:yes stop_codon:yes gene_type:complete